MLSPGRGARSFGPSAAAAALLCCALLLPTLISAGEIACGDEPGNPSSTHPISETETGCDHCAGCLTSHGHLLAMQSASPGAVPAPLVAAAPIPTSPHPAAPAPEEIFHPPISAL